MCAFSMMRMQNYPPKRARHQTRLKDGAVGVVCVFVCACARALAAIEQSAIVRSSENGIVCPKLKLPITLLKAVNHRQTLAQFWAKFHSRFDNVFARIDRDTPTDGTKRRLNGGTNQILNFLLLVQVLTYVVVNLPHLHSLVL